MIAAAWQIEVLQRNILRRSPTLDALPEATDDALPMSLRALALWLTLGGRD
jgi:hypothetical protein